VLVVERANEVQDIPHCGRRFSARILKAMARGRAGAVVEFLAKDIRQMAPEQFLLELGRRIGLDGLETYPEPPQEERQATRWYAVDLPRWFGTRLEARGRAALTAVPDVPIDPDTGSALGRELVLRELTWIVIEGIDEHPPEGGIKELIAGMMAITDTESVVGPGLRSLRWLVVGYVPDFVRERSIQYRRDTVSPLAIGDAEWVECLGTAWLAHGRRPEDFPGAVAKSLYRFYESINPEIREPSTRLPALAAAVPSALAAMMK
jgi:hypothetical protein